ncbi:hypothetical protein C8J57DRAFT_1056257 [Mycena rebaudengoi]|nr:hypothetical protein C8J57DRAFT_1056257 [Mycena rebaudengoi]
MLFYLLSLLFALFPHASAATTSNRTIDDEVGDSVSGVKPTYEPLSYWNLQGTSCANCTAKPDASLAFSGTWHDSSSFPGQDPVSCTLSFTGTAIQVFVIVPPFVEGQTGDYNLAFTFDGDAAGTYSQSASPSDYLYNVSALSMDSLSNTPHTLVMSTNPDSANGSIFLFDYAIYTA